MYTLSDVMEYKNISDFHYEEEINIAEFLQMLKLIYVLSSTIKHLVFQLTTHNTQHTTHTQLYRYALRKTLV